MIEAVVFDLDDTLYPELDFVRSGYRAVAHYVGSRIGIPSHEISRAMMKTLRASGRKAVFPMVMTRFPQCPASLAELVEIYRGHSPHISLLPGYHRLLRGLRGRYRLGIITDGLPAVQKRKIEALKLQGAVDKIIYTGEYVPERGKPDPWAFSLFLQEFRIEPRRAVYVGDNPGKDCIGAHRAGMRFAMVGVPGDRVTLEQPQHDKPEFVIESLHQLPQVLQTAD